MITIYSTPTCPYCKIAKEYFKSKNLQFEDFNVAADMAKREEMFKLTGEMAVPVIKIGEHVILGFDKDAIEKALQDQK